MKVLWSGKWWPAHVIGFRKVHYVGWSKNYDEWVEDHWVGNPPAKRLPAKAAPTMEVLWGGTWWPATKLDSRSGLIKILYIGWDNVRRNGSAPDVFATYRSFPYGKLAVAPDSAHTRRARI